MNFSRAKTILIFIFIFVNIFLMVVYNLFYQEQAAISSDTVVTILSNNGITVDESLIKNYGSTLSGVEIENIATDKERIAALFLGDTFNKTRENYYTNTKASLQISDLAIEYKVTEPSDRGFKDITVLNAGNLTLKALNKQGIGKSALVVSNVSNTENKNFFITFTYKFKNYPVFNNNLYATVSDKGISSVGGTVISFKDLKNESYDITPTANILVELAGNNELKALEGEKKVTDIQLGYYLPLGKTEASMYAIPCYAIEINNKTVYYYDARENISPEFILLGNK